MSKLYSRRTFTAATAGGLLASNALSGQGALQASPTQQDSKADAQPPAGPREAPFERDYPPPKFKPSWKNPQLNREQVQDFVIYAHSDLEMVKKLLDKTPGLIHGAIDWGAGDFETALGGASHMGRHDIVEHLLDRGARIDLFCAAMMGQLDAVRAFLMLEPKLIDAKGPHGFSLHFHAQVGGEESAHVLEYLQSIKQVELRPIPFLQNKKPAKKES